MNKLMLQQEDAVAANELLNEAFGHDAVGNITFPNDFAGARIEENKLVLSLTNTALITQQNISIGSAIMQTALRSKR